MIHIGNWYMAPIEVLPARFMNSEPSLRNWNTATTYNEKDFIWSKIEAEFPLYEKGFSRFFHWFTMLEPVGVFRLCWRRWVRFSGRGDSGWLCLFVFVVDGSFVFWFFDVLCSGNLFPFRSFLRWFCSFSVVRDWSGSTFGGFTFFGAAYLRRLTKNSYSG